MQVFARALAVEMPPVKGHPNRTPFKGVLTVVDVASERPPAGARGHRVMLTRQAAESALPSLIGMALDYTPALDAHDSRRKVGIITSAEVVGGELEIKGYLFARDFPELMAELQGCAGTLGLSYELADVRVEDVAAPIWKLVEVTFTGAAILLRKKAAYEGTWIKTALSANFIGPGSEKSHRGEHKPMEDLFSSENNFLSITERMASAAEALNITVSRMEAQHQGLSAKIDRIVATIGATVEPGEAEGILKTRVAELERTNAELRIKLEAGTNTFHATPAARKTLPALVTALLAKSGVEIADGMDAAALDATLAPLSIEQRIAVKSQMAKAGLIA